MSLKKLLDKDIKKKTAIKIDEACFMAESGEVGSTLISKDEDVTSILEKLKELGYHATYKKVEEGYQLNLKYE